MSEEQNEVVSSLDGASKGAAASDGAGRELSAATVGRMLGLATSVELKVIDSKLELLSTKFSSQGVKVEKVISSIATIPSTSDLERIELQVSSIKQTVREIVKEELGLLLGEIQKLVSK